MSDRFFKFLKADGSPTHGPQSFRWPMPNGAPGEWARVEGELVPCENGFHLVRFAGWRDWGSALMYECEGRGDHISKDGSVVEVFREARLIRRVDEWNGRSLRLFACDCAEHVIHFYEEQYPGDVRLRYCIDTARAFAEGKATREELAAAWAAAWDAAGAAAWAAAWDAARAAAWDAARDAEVAWQDKRLMEVLRL